MPGKKKKACGSKDGVEQHWRRVKKFNPETAKKHPPAVETAVDVT